MKWKPKDIVGPIVLGVVAVTAILSGQDVLAGTAVGFLGAWILKNGVQKETTA